MKPPDVKSLTVPSMDRPCCIATLVATACAVNGRSCQAAALDPLGARDLSLRFPIDATGTHKPVSRRCGKVRARGARAARRAGPRAAAALRLARRAAPSFLVARTRRGNRAD